jgi:hypothetical protein
MLWLAPSGSPFAPTVALGKDALNIGRIEQPTASHRPAYHVEVAGIGELTNASRCDVQDARDVVRFKVFKYWRMRHESQCDRSEEHRGPYW